MRKIPILLLCSLLIMGQSGTPHGVNITWTAPAPPVGGSGQLAGYNIYRCSNGNTTPCTLSAGTWVKIDTSLDVTTGYLDQSTLNSGQAYSYAATSVDTNNNESAFSNIATVTFSTITNPNPPTGCNAKQQ